MKNLKQKLTWLFVTHLGRILLGVILSIFGGFMSGTFNQQWVGYEVMLVIGWLIIIVEFIIMMAFAVKNFINEVIKK